MNKISKIFYKAPCEVSWVGECPWTNTLCFGGEDGVILIEAPGPSEIGQRRILSMQLATDAINEVAFVGDLIAVSSRNEVVVARQSTQGSDDLDCYDHRFIGGADGVVASRGGAFLAPIADQGLLMLKVNDGRLGTQIGSPSGVPFNFYKLIRLGNDLDGEVFVAAGRRDGVMALDFAHGSPSGPMVRHHFEGHDIVDVCSLNDSCHPLAVACVNRERAIFFIRDVLEDQTPIAMNYGGLQGTAYTLLSAQGHLFLLTNRELVVMPSAATRFLRGESFEQPLEIGIIPVNAAEAFLLQDRSVLLIEEGAIVSELKVADMVGTSTEAYSGAEWSRNGLAHQGDVVELLYDVRQVQSASIDPGWQPITEFDLVTSPAA